MVDDDGRETRAQRCVELYFWLMLTLIIFIDVLAISYVAHPQLIDIDGEGATEPERVQRVARMLGIGTAAGDDTVRRVAEIFLILNVVYFVICVVLTIFVAFLLRAAAKIVTTYEIRQGFLVYSTFLHTALGCAFLYLGGVGLIFKDSQAKLVPLPEETDRYLTALFVLMLLLGALLLPLGLVGVFAAAVEDIKLLKRFECGNLWRAERHIKVDAPPKPRTSMAPR